MKNILIPKESNSTRPYVAYRAMQVSAEISKTDKISVIDLNAINDVYSVDFDDEIVIIFDLISSLCNDSFNKFVIDLSRNHKIIAVGRLSRVYDRYIKKIFPFIETTNDDLDYDRVIIKNPQFLVNRQLYSYAPALSSVGCNGECVFCANKIIETFNSNIRCWYPLDHDKVIEYICNAKKQYDYSNFSFIDNNFLGDVKTINIFLEQLKKQKIFYRAEARADCVCIADIEQLWDSGMRRLSIGIESGNDSTLKRYGKKTTVNQNENAIKLIRRNHIKLDPQFIMFDPQITYSEVEGNLDFIGRNELYNYISSSTLLNKMYVFNTENPKEGWQYNYKDEKVKAFELKLKENNIKNINSYATYKIVKDIFFSI